ncbi:MAG: hypothetical protein WDM91_03580 [Rhizomicrobium sp.]
MRRLAAALALLALLAPGADAAGRIVTLTLPRAAAADEEIVLRVRAGVLRRGMEVDLYDGRGSLLGTVSPFAIRGGHEAGTYSIPLGTHPTPGRRLTIRLVLTEFGKPPRAPTRLEVRGVTSAFVGITR